MRPCSGSAHRISEASPHAGDASRNCAGRIHGNVPRVCPGTGLRQPRGRAESKRERGTGLTQDELARRAGTSRTTLLAYENGRKSPTVATFARLLSEAGCELAAQPQVTFTRQPAARGRCVWVPDHLPRLDMAHAFARVRLPLHLNWSTPRRAFEVVLQEGRPADILAYVDGALLVEPWDDLVLPRPARSAWTPVVNASRGLAT
jgi:transcriptional regulator with XRE-family HTH domain